MRGSLLLAVITAVVLAARRVLRTPTPDPAGLVFQPQPFPAPPRPLPGDGGPGPGEAIRHVAVPPGVDPEGGPQVEGHLAGIAPWTEPVSGTCPPSHPIKAKVGSGIYHAPGGLYYERTRPDRCYLDPSAAEADGFRRSRH